jgi:hypothetical protein
VFTYGGGHHDAEISYIVTNSDDTIMFTCGWDGRSNLWDLVKRTHLHEFERN